MYIKWFLLSLSNSSDLPLQVEQNISNKLVSDLMEPSISMHLYIFYQKSLFSHIKYKLDVQLGGDRQANEAASADSWLGVRRSQRWHDVMRRHKSNNNILYVCTY